MPDIDALYRHFKDRGFVVLAISDEDKDKVAAFLSAHPVSYHILLDPGDKVHDLFQVQGIPNSFVYDPTGKMVAVSIDMRTRQQFQLMLAAAGLHEIKRGIVP
jgi:peroxiredoxin